MSPASIGGEFFVLLTGGEHLSLVSLKRKEEIKKAANGKCVSCGKKILEKIRTGLLDGKLSRADGPGVFHRNAGGARRRWSWLRYRDPSDGG